MKREKRKLGGKEWGYEKRRKEEGERGEEGARGVSIYFWNITGIANKCEKTWEYLEEFDGIRLTKTWTEEEIWRKMIKKMMVK